MGRSRREQPLYLSEKLLQVRTRLNLSQSELIRRLGKVGEKLRAGHVSEFESGVREPTLPVLLQYSRIAGVPLEVLVDDELELPEFLPAELVSEWIMVKRDRKIHK